MSFGKKGLAPGQASPAQSGFGRAEQSARSAAPATKQGADAQEPLTDAGDVAAAREAFIASERARRAEEAGVAAEREADNSMASLRNAARPASRAAQPLGNEQVGGGPMGASGMTQSQEAEIRAAALGMASNKSARNSGSGRSSSGFVFGDPAGRSIGLAYVLWFILGQLSLHRFYCGQKDSAFMQLGLFFGSLVVMFIFPIFGFVGFGVWICWLFGDLFMIPGMLRKFQAEHDYRSVFN